MMRFESTWKVTTKPHSFEIVTTIDNILYGYNKYNFNSEWAQKLAHVSESMVLSGESFRIWLNVYWLHDGFGGTFK